MHDDCEITCETQGCRSPYALTCTGNNGDRFGGHNISSMEYLHQKLGCWRKPNHERVSRPASKITSITRSGSVYIGVWSTRCDRRLAPIRLAMKRWVFGLIMRSSSASKNQEGFVFQAGADAGSSMHGRAIGRCTAAIMLIWSADALWATARRNPSSGIHRKPCLSGVNF